MKKKSRISYNISSALHPVTIPSDAKILAAVFTASASIISVVLTYLNMRLTEHANKRMQDKLHLMAVRNKIAVNRGLSSDIEKNTQTFGFVASFSSLMARIIGYE